MAEPLSAEEREAEYLASRAAEAVQGANALTRRERDRLIGGSSLDREDYRAFTISDGRRYEATCRALEAERDRLRAVLEWIAHSEPPSPDTKVWTAEAYIEAARDALAPDPPAGT